MHNIDYMDRDIYTQTFLELISYSDEKVLIYNKIKDYVRDSSAQSILDIGAGDGTLAYMLKDLSKTYVAIEPNSIFCENLKKLQVEVIKQSFPIKIAGTFDVVLFSHSISLTPSKYQEYIETAKNLLSESGVIIIITARGKKDDISAIISPYDSDYVNHNLDGFKSLKKHLNETGTIWEDHFTATINFSSKDDLKKNLSFFYADGFSQKNKDFMHYLKSVEPLAFEKYKNPKSNFYNFPVENTILTWKPYMEKKSVFLLADIGLGKAGYFHVGDEAMFNNNLKKHKQDGYQIFCSSRSMSHLGLDVHESLDIYINNPLTLICLLYASLIYKLFNTTFFFPPYFRKSVSHLKRSEVLHVSGGGNVNSFWSGHIYYRLLMVVLAKLFRKEIIITSQTFGPFTNIFHKTCAALMIRLSDHVGVRDARESYSFSEKHNKSTILEIDDAHDLLPYTINLAPSWGTRKVGVSLHAWDKSRNTNALIKALEEHLLPTDEIYIIPHVLTTSNNSDNTFMKTLDCFKTYRDIDFAFFEENNISRNKIPEVIKYLYSKMDFVITSRYHGLVFASSYNKPILVINYDDYYQQKSQGYISMLNPEVANIIKTITL